MIDGVFSGRLDLAMADNGLTNAQFAAGLGPTGQKLVNNWRKRGRVGMKSEKRVAALLPLTNLEWLQYGTGDRLRKNATAVADRTGPYVVNESSPNSNDLRQSLAARLDRVMLASALKVLLIDEAVGGEYPEQRRADVLIDVYDQLTAGADPMMLAATITQARGQGDAHGEKQAGRPKDH